MIKNFLLDMGNVVLRWDPQYIVSRYSESPEVQRQLLDATVYTPDWALIDEGAISDEAVLGHAILRVPEALRPMLKDMLDTWHTHMPPMPGVCAFVRLLKKKGYKVYILSNAGARFPKCIEHLEVYGLVDGAVFSAHERVVKPDPRIYNILLERYGLNARECLFLDDIEANVAGARAVGIEGFVFDGDFTALKEKLKTIGIDLSED